MWRSCESSWFVEHLASTANTTGAASLILSMVAYAWASASNGFQVWFRSDNKLPKRIFGDIVAECDAAHVSGLGFHYCTADKTDLHCNEDIQRMVVIECNGEEKMTQIARSMITELRGSAFAEVEDFDRDPLLAQIDLRYRSRGLRRYRRIFLAFMGDTAVGCAVAYRGPLGLNFSFLENRCDILLRADLDASYRLSAISSLASGAAVAYKDWSPPWIPITMDASDLDMPPSLQYIRSYTQTICLRPALSDFHDGLRALYGRLLKRHLREGSV